MMCSFESSAFNEGSTWSIWHPKVLWYYFLRRLGGNALHEINGDPNQLGGDFLIAQEDGSLLLNHRSEGD